MVNKWASSGELWSPISAKSADIADLAELQGPIREQPPANWPKQAK
ncbi:hypothetical protein PAENIP36_70230 [Paenibacillus sp. P36]